MRAIASLAVLVGLGITVAAPAGFTGATSIEVTSLADAAVLAFLTVLATRISWWETTKAERSEAAYADMLGALEAHFATHR